MGDTPSKRILRLLGHSFCFLDGHRMVNLACCCHNLLASLEAPVHGLITLLLTVSHPSQILYRSGVNEPAGGYNSTSAVSASCPSAERSVLLLPAHGYTRESWFLIDSYSWLPQAWEWYYSFSNSKDPMRGSLSFFVLSCLPRAGLWNVIFPFLVLPLPELFSFASFFQL